MIGRGSYRAGHGWRLGCDGVPDGCPLLARPRIAQVLYPFQATTYRSTTRPAGLMGRVDRPQPCPQAGNR